MSARDWGGLALFCALLIGLAWPLGVYMAAVYEGRARRATAVLGWLERGLLRLLGPRATGEMDWKQYAFAVLAFSLCGVALTYALQRMQAFLPLNPTGMPAVPGPVAFNTAISFVTNTNWQAYGGESTMSHLTQLLALTTQNFVSAATGMGVLVALVRGLRQKEQSGVGNFWVDLVRSVVYVLLPLSLVLGVVLIHQGVVQTLDGVVQAGGQSLSLGPVASQEAIKQLGTNGGGFYNVNSAHPFENPTALSNLLEILAILILPTAFCFTFGRMMGDDRQGYVLLAAKLLVFIPLVVLCTMAEARGNPALHALGVDGANFEGKEVRFGIFGSTLWATATTAASNGSVNAMHDSFTPLGGMIPMWLMQLGEIIFGGVGSGLYGLLVYAILAVFLSGLMVGRTPEYLGKKIEPREVKLTMLALLILPLAMLAFTAIAAVIPEGIAGRLNQGPHGFAEMLYAYTSAAANNGSAFAGLSANTPFYNLTLGVAMFMGRFLMIVPMLAIAGSLAEKTSAPQSAGTFPTHGGLFIGLLVGSVLIIGGLTFLPALALGPIVEQIAMLAGQLF